MRIIAKHKKNDTHNSKCVNVWLSTTAAGSEYLPDKECDYSQDSAISRGGSMPSRMLW